MHDNPDDQLNVAQGYFELGMFLDADAQIEEIDPNLRHTPQVLNLRAQIYCALEKWDLMLVVARRLVVYDPQNIQWIVWRAFATRRAESLEAANEWLREATERHPEAALLHYNLACYACQLGQLDVAKARLCIAFKLDKKLRVLALDDADLAPLWKEVELGDIPLKDKP